MQPHLHNAITNCFSVVIAIIILSAYQIIGLLRIF